MLCEYVTYNAERGLVRNLVSLSLSLREEHELKVFENRVLRRIFGSEREEDG
jgi:hypothetical protein